MPNILGIKLNNLSRKEAINEIGLWLKGNRQGYAVTPNPEIILNSLTDDKLKHIINSADFSFADGFGLKLVGLFKGQRIKRTTGSDLSFELLNLANNNGYKVAIIIWNKGLSSKDDVNQSLKAKYPKLDCLVLESEREESLNDNIINQVNQYLPQILFVALGSPEQEKIMYNNLKLLKSIKFAIGVGGTFDFITKKAKRAPRILRYLGLEWLWRLIIQPSRIKRIYRATFVFIYKALTHKNIL